jgi:hypothetical protein
MKYEIYAVAALIESTVDDGTAERLNYVTTRNFGPVRYRAVAIPSSSHSYRPPHPCTSDSDEEA